jgi:hypothetical protein
MTVSIMPMQWTPIDKLYAVPPLSDDDMECMAELRKALLKHNAVDRFAIHLVHRHFDMKDDEILVEYSDIVARTQTIRVEKTQDTLADGTPTTWMLKDDVKPTTYCVCVPADNEQHGHEYVNE